MTVIEPVCNNVSVCLEEKYVMSHCAQYLVSIEHLWYSDYRTCSLQVLKTKLSFKVWLYSVSKK